MPSQKKPPESGEDVTDLMNVKPGDDVTNLMNAASSNDQFTTKLTPEEEPKFQQWIKKNNITDLDHPNSHYDYRGFWRENPNFQHKPGEHFTDKFKQPGHPTFSVESKYAAGRTDAGSWNGDTFIPPDQSSESTTPQVGEPQDDSFLTRAWKAINSPMVDIRSATPEVKNATDAFAKDHPYIGGALNFGTDALSSLTSPLNIATTGAFAGAGAADVAGLPSIAKGLQIGGKVLSAPVTAEGAYNTFSPDSTMPERAGGLAEMIGGISGMRSKLPAIGNGIKTGESPQINPDEIKSAGSGMTPEAQATAAIGSTPISKPKTIYLKSATIEDVKKARELGYKYVGKTSDGRFKMEYTGEPSSPILEGETANVRPTAANAQRQKLGPNIDPQQSSFLKEAYNTARAATTTFDISAPARQGLPLIGTKAWWTSWDDMLKSFGSEKAFQLVQQGIADNPLFKERLSPTGKKIPSFASEAGLKLTDLTNLSSREEAIASNWLEKIPGYGKGVRASNRAYTAFLNKLRADHFESLINDSKAMGIDPMKDLTTAREIAEFVNNATGRGSLRASIPSTVNYFGKDYKVPSAVAGKGIDLERHAELLSNIFFSPRNMASRMQMMNPVNYTMASPFIRKQYLKSMASTVSAWMTVAGLAKLAGADVSLDPTNADFGKIKIGDARLDPAGGFQQYLVLFTRLAQGKYTSSTTGQEHEFGQGFKPETRASTAMNFGVNKLHPMLKFGYDMMNASKYRPFSVGDRVAKMFVPMLASDINELIQEDPKLAVMLGPAAAIGMGTQYYNEKGQGHPLVPENMDYQFTGGPFGQ